MTAGRFVFIIITFSFCYALDENQEDEYNNFEDMIHEGSPWEAKLAADLSGFRAESIRKLDSIDRKIPDNFEDAINSKLSVLEKKIPEILKGYLDHKFDILGKQNHEIELGILEKIHKLEKNILDKIQDYVDDRFNLLEKFISRKLDAFEKLIPDKTDISIVNHKLDALKKIHLDLNENNHFDYNKLANETSTSVEEGLNKGFIELESKIFIATNTTYLQLNILDQKITKLEENLRTAVVPDIEIIKRNLDVVDKKIPENVEKHISYKLDLLEKKILNLKENLNNECDTLGNKLTNTIDYKINEMQKKIPELELNINKKIDVLETLENTVLKEMSKSQCKELSVSGITYWKPYIRTDDNTLNHVTITKNSDGNTNLEMHFAVKSSALYTYILLSPSLNPDLEKDNAIEIGIFPGSIRLLKNRTRIAIEYISDSLSPIQFTKYYLLIENGKLDFGKEGSTDIITFNDAPSYFTSLQYFTFSGSRENRATFLYDCPPTHRA